MSSKRTYHHMYTRQDIEAYHAGKLSPADMHAMEKAALKDPLLADAIEGYAGADTAVSAAHLADIERMLLADQQKHKPASTVPPVRWWRVAAAVLVLAGAGTIAWLLMDTSSQKERFTAQTLDKRERAGIGTPTDDSSASSHAAPVAANGPSDTDKPAVAAKQIAVNKPVGNNAKTSHPVPVQQQATAMASVPPAPPPAQLADTIVLAETMAKKAQLAAKQRLSVNEAAALRMANLSTRVRPATPSLTLAEFTGDIITEDKQPLRGATVLVGPVNQGVLTDQNGVFRFMSVDTPQKITVSAVGFQPRDTVITAGTPVTLAMKDSRDALNEVVVASFQPQRKREMPRSYTTSGGDSIQPAGGWDKLKTALIEKIRSSGKNTAPKGRITALMSFGADNHVQNVVITGSMDHAIDKLTENLLKEWPGWMLGSKKTPAGTYPVSIDL